MTEYDPLTLLTVDELKAFDDLSGVTLYKAETHHIPPLTTEEQNALLAEARKGSIAARNRVLMSCLRLTIRMAEYKTRERRMRHSDITDLLGTAHISMLEKFPKALAQEDPIHYLMTAMMYDMKHYMLYHDPMVQRSRQVTFDPSHPITESGEAVHYETVPAPQVPFVTEEPAKYNALHSAIVQLTPLRRTAISRRFGLDGHSAESVREIAQSEGRTPRSIDSAILNGRRSLAKALSGK